MNRFAAFLCLVAFTFLMLLESSAQPVSSIAGGQYHSLFLRTDSSLWAMGYNSDGQLGDGMTNTNFYVTLPELIISNGVTQIAAGGNFSLFIMSDGSLWAMGGDEYGQLGDKSNNYYGTNTPELIVSNSVTAIAAGANHSLFLKSDGSLWAMGFDEYGQLGDGTNGVGAYYSTNRPELILSNSVVAIAAGGNHSLFIKSDGSLWAMGYNYYGELGNGTNVNTNRPQMIVSNSVTAIAAGLDHSLFLKSDGSLWGMGRDDFGQLGDLTYTSTNKPKLILSNSVTAISAGGNHSMYLKSDGSLWTMGEDTYGELGNGVFLTNSPYGTNQPQLIVSNGVTRIVAGGYHSLFVKSDGGLWAMGYQSYGELGDGTNGVSPYYSTNRPEQIIPGSATYNKIIAQGLSGGTVRLTYAGVAGLNYALDRSFTVRPVAWVPQSTNTAGTNGSLVLTNTPAPGTNNFYRIRSVP